MDETTLPPRPPMVLFRDRVAWVRARRQTDLGAWLALIFWATMVGPDHQAMERWVPLADIARLDTED
ncbi:MAG: hypothetical protein ABR585_07635 [Gemmatimonadaceae bacterium]